MIIFNARSLYESFFNSFNSFIEKIGIFCGIKSPPSGARTFKNTSLKEKVIFFQDENLRLSHDLSKSQKKYDIMKEQLTDIEIEKINISNKISELTESLGQTNLVKSAFKQDKVVKKISSKKIDENIDINDQIKKIFKS